jgi:hypothetical protein
MGYKYVVLGYKYVRMGYSSLYNKFHICIYAFYTVNPPYCGVFNCQLIYNPKLTFNETNLRLFTQPPLCCFL